MIYWFLFSSYRETFQPELIEYDFSLQYCTPFVLLPSSLFCHSSNSRNALIAYLFYYNLDTIRFLYYVIIDFTDFCVAPDIGVGHSCQNIHEVFGSSRFLREAASPCE